jgi:hypothetical protein
VDLVVQVGWQEGKRRVLGVWETLPDLDGGNVVFRRVYLLGDADMGEVSRSRV